MPCAGCWGEQGLCGNSLTVAKVGNAAPGREDDGRPRRVHIAMVALGLQLGLRVGELDEVDGSSGSTARLRARERRRVVLPLPPVQEEARGRRGGGVEGADEDGLADGGAVGIEGQGIEAVGEAGGEENGLDGCGSEQGEPREEESPRHHDIERGYLSRDTLQPRRTGLGGAERRRGMTR